MKNKKLILLSMIIISIFTIKNTNASSVVNRYYTSTYTYGGLTASTISYSDFYKKVDVQPNNNNYLSKINIDVNDIVIPDYANSFTIPFSITDLTNKSNKLTCIGQQETQTTFNFAFQTTYTDGTTSQNNGVINEGISHPTFCNEWQIESMNDYSININWRDDQNVTINCQIVKTGESYNVVCPIDRRRTNGTRKLSNIDIIITKKNTDNTTNLRFEIGEILTYQIDEEFQILEKLNEINNKLNQDISEEDKEQPNTANFESSKQQEENIKNSISNANPNDITFNTDLTATSKIWEIVTNFLNTNSKVMGLMISILSLGVIKMILNR